MGADRGPAQRHRHRKTLGNPGHAPSCRLTSVPLGALRKAGRWEMTAVTSFQASAVTATPHARGPLVTRNISGCHLGTLPTTCTALPGRPTATDGKGQTADRGQNGLSKGPSRRPGCSGGLSCLCPPLPPGSEQSGLPCGRTRLTP